MKIELDVPYDMIEQIVVKDLVQSYLYQAMDASLPKEGLPPHKLQDRKDGRKNCKALLKVIKFYTTEQQFKDLALDQTSA